MEEITTVILHHSAPHRSAQCLDRPAKYLVEEETFGLISASSEEFLMNIKFRSSREANSISEGRTL